MGEKFLAVKVPETVVELHSATQELIKEGRHAPGMSGRYRLPWVVRCWLLYLLHDQGQHLKGWCGLPLEDLVKLGPDQGNHVKRLAEELKVSTTNTFFEKLGCPSYVKLPDLRTSCPQEPIEFVKLMAPGDHMPP